MFEIPEWPYALGKPRASGFIRSCVEDFVVEEIPRVHPEGEGSHLWLWVEKRAANTDWVARELARVAECPVRDVGFAGIKDRHAISRQWFSVPVGESTLENLEHAGIDGVNILAYRRNTRKLQRGTLNGNRFQLKIRGFNGDTSETVQRLERIRASGVPNYFGPQRFGFNGLNVDKGFSLLSKRARLARNKRSIYLSAIRSFLFNQVLAERVRRGNWAVIMDGELAMLNGTQSIFPCEMPDTEIEERCRRLDIHPTGPLPGEKGTQPLGAVAEMEQSVLQRWTQLTELLVSMRVEAGRRALRLYPAGLEWRFADNDLDLVFALPPGAYATTVLREILVFTGAERISHQEI